MPRYPASGYNTADGGAVEDAARRCREDLRDARGHVRRRPTVRTHAIATPRGLGRGARIAKGRVRRGSDAGTRAIVTLREPGVGTSAEPETHHTKRSGTRGDSLSECESRSFSLAAAASPPSKASLAAEFVTGPIRLQENETS